MVFSSGDRSGRVMAFLDPWKDSQAFGFQLIQSYIAFGNGGVTGRGIGLGTQKLFYLPEAHTDFIFAIIGEELGLVATLAVVTTYLIQFVAGVIHLRRAPSTYQYLLAAGCVLLISVQSILNLGVVTGVLPTTGLPLPFVSYGGSNYLTMGLCVAILLNTSVAWRQPALNETRRKLRDIE